MAKEKISGIYCVYNKKSNKAYIGKSVNCKKRLSEHRSVLIAGKHHSAYLQRSFNFHGIENFEFYVIIDYKDKTDEELYFMEKALILMFETYKSDFGYNMDLGGKGSLGLKHTDESKRKISEVQKGKILSEEHKQKISNSHKGITPKNYKILEKYRDEHRQKVLVYTIAGDLFIEFDSINDCARYFNSHATNVVKTLKGKHKTFKGYLLFYKDSFSESELEYKKSEVTTRMISRYKEYGRFN